MRVLVNKLLDWHGAPIILGLGKTHVVTYADILRDLEPLNKGRDKRDRIAYDSLWVHAKRHYDDAGITAYWRARMHSPIIARSKACRKVESSNILKAAHHHLSYEVSHLSYEVIREGVLQYSTKYFVNAIKNEFAGYEGGAEAAQDSVTALQYLNT